MSIWQGERYHGERMVVNGELIDHYAYEFGDDSLEVAKQYDAEQFDALLEARMQHWIEHHDKVLGNTAKVLERENKELRELVQAMHLLMDESCAVKYPYPPKPISYYWLTCIEDRMREMGIEVDE